MREPCYPIEGSGVLITWIGRCNGRSSKPASLMVSAYFQQVSLTNPLQVREPKELLHVTGPQSPPVKQEPGQRGCCAMALSRLQSEQALQVAPVLGSSGEAHPSVTTILLSDQQKQHRDPSTATDLLCLEIPASRGKNILTLKCCLSQ